MKLIRICSVFMLVTGIAGLTGCASGPGGGTAQASAPSPAVQSANAQPSAPQRPALPSMENIYSPMPLGYVKSAESRTDVVHTVQFAPRGQTIESLTDSITTQAFYRTPITLEQHYRDVLSGWAKNCPTGTASNYVQAAANGYPAIVWQSRCPLNIRTKQPESTNYLAVRGKNNLYVVQVTMRANPTPQWQVQTQAYLRSVTVCDLNDPAHPCPAPSQNQR